MRFDFFISQSIRLSGDGYRDGSNIHGKSSGHVQNIIVRLGARSYEQNICAVPSRNVSQCRRAVHQSNDGRAVVHTLLRRDAGNGQRTLVRRKGVCRSCALVIGARSLRVCNRYRRCSLKDY